MPQSKKVLHVLGAMDIGGVETWLMSILRIADTERFKHEFIVHRDKKAYFDDEITQLGSEKYICKPDNVFKYMFNLFFLLKKLKPDVVHSHVHTFSGFVMFISWLAGVKVRISHSHSDKRLVEKNVKIIRSVYIRLMRIFINTFSTSNIAVSEKAAESLFGEDWSDNPKSKVIYCGVDYSKFRNIKNDISYRESLSIPKDAFVIGHVGRFEEPKNHKFILEVFNQLRQLDNKYYLVLVGDGSLKSDIENIVSQLDIATYVKFMGNRSDVPEIMINLFDVFIFPSLWEGLPLTLVEAQFAKLPCIVSKNVTKECDLGISKYLDIHDTSDWIAYIEDLPNVKIKKSFGSSIFNLENTNIKLYNEYLN